MDEKRLVDIEVRTNEYNGIVRELITEVRQQQWNYAECMNQYNIQQKRACDAEAEVKALKAVAAHQDEQRQLDKDFAELGDDVVRRLRAELAQVKAENATTCTWKETHNGNWYTACGKAWYFIEDGPEKVSDVDYCNTCGKKVVFEKHLEDIGESDKVIK